MVLTGCVICVLRGRVTLSRSCHRRLAIQESRPRVVRSPAGEVVVVECILPREAAIGVATLSGFMESRRDSRITWGGGHYEPF